MTARNDGSPDADEPHIPTAQRHDHEEATLMPDEDVRKAVEALKTWWESEGWNLLNVDHPLPYEQIVAVVIKALPVGGDDG